MCCAVLFFFDLIKQKCTFFILYLSYVLGPVRFIGIQLCKILFDIEELENSVEMSSAKHHDTSNDDVDSKTSSKKARYDNETVGSGLETLDSGIKSDFNSLFSVIAYDK